MAKKIKKVDVKAVAKETVMTVVERALIEAGFKVSDGESFGMTKGTIVVHTEASDVQIKPIAPKTGLTHYEAIEEEETE